MSGLEKRRDKIAEFIKRQGTVTFGQLVELFPQVSEMTLRKDLKQLDSQGQIIRIHGGARSLDTLPGTDTPLVKRMSQNMDKKRGIAQKAKELISPGNAVFLDSGSTMTELAKVYPDQPGMVFTGGLSCLNELTTLQQTDVYVLGGKLNKNSLSVRDVAMASMVEDLHFDLAFISVNGFTAQSGFTCRSSFRWELEKVIIRRSGKVIVLMDSSKVGLSNPFSICMPREVDIVVCDHELDEETRKLLEEEGVRVL